METGGVDLVTTATVRGNSRSLATTTHLLLIVSRTFCDFIGLSGISGIVFPGISYRDLSLLGDRDDSLYSAIFTSLLLSFLSSQTSSVLSQLLGFTGKMAGLPRGVGVEGENGLSGSMFSEHDWYSDSELENDFSLVRVTGRTVFTGLGGFTGNGGFSAGVKGAGLEDTGFVLDFPGLGDMGFRLGDIGFGLGDICLRLGDMGLCLGDI